MSGSQGLDWAGARARLLRIQKALEMADTPSPEQLVRIYAERARRLARPSSAIEPFQAAGMLTVFRLGEERYAFPVAVTTEVLPEFKMTPVPGAPPMVAGVIQVRGDIRPVYNLHRQLGVLQRDAAKGPVILMRVENRQFGIQVDAVEEVRAVKNDDRKTPGQAAHVTWITEDLVTVLRAELLWKKEA